MNVYLVSETWGLFANAVFNAWNWKENFFVVFIMSSV